MKSVLNFIKTKKGVGICILILIILFNIVLLWSELSMEVHNVNDEIYHQIASKQASSALEKGYNPTDFVLNNIELGFPLFHHYHHLPQLIVGTIHYITHGSVSVSFIFNIFRYLFLVLFPLSIFLAMRRFGFDYLASALSALLSPLVSYSISYGINYSSYIWSGSGMFQQLWAMFFLPIALAEIYRFLKEKKNLFLTIFLASIVALSHVFYAYILFLSAVVFILINFKKEEIFKRAKRLILVCILVGVVVSYFVIPLYLDVKYTNISQYVGKWKYNSFGASGVMSKLLQGNIFDAGRFPSITILFFASLIIFFIFKKYKEEKYRLLGILTLFWLILFFGRPFLGFIFDLIPFSSFLQIHRFVAAFQIFSIMLAGAGLSILFKKIDDFGLKLFVATITIVLLLPVFVERGYLYQRNKNYKIETQKNFECFKGELNEIKETLNNLPPGRVYAGMPSNWGDYPYYKIGYIPLYSILPQYDIDTFGYSYHSEGLATDTRFAFNDNKKEQYNLFNIKYVLLHKSWTPASFYSKVKEFSNYILYKVKTTGYFDLVQSPVVFYGDKNRFSNINIAWLNSSLPLEKIHPLLQINKEPVKTFGKPVFAFQNVNKNLLGQFSNNNTTQNGKILKEEVENDKYYVDFESNQDCFLIFKTNYHPDWKAYLDGEEVATYMLSPGYVGIKVAPGNHKAYFVYRSPFYRKILFNVGLFVLILILIYEFKFRKN